MKNLLQRLFGKSISTTELKSLDTQAITLLDVRTPSEFRGGHIARAKNVPLDKIDAYKGDTSQLIYVICQSGVRSKRACSILKSKGFDVINVRGGMNNWQGPIQGGKL